MSTDEWPVPEPLPLDDAIASQRLQTITGLDLHFLSAGAEDAPLLLLLHGFPELAFSWRRVLPPLAAAGYRVVAPDLRGYGRTTGWDDRYRGDLGEFSMPNLVGDLLALLQALGRDSVRCVVGHDFGSSLAAWAALLRPDIFTSAVLMSAPFGGPPDLGATDRNPDAGLRELTPPRKHYRWYYTTPEANRDMWRAPQGVPAFLRAYFHMKSADWPGNTPRPLARWSARELARLPEYYVMKLGDSMADTVAAEMPDDAACAACEWLSESDLAVYAAEYRRSGFQGGLNWYRTSVSPAFNRDLAVYSGRPIEVPLTFLAGQADWGYQQTPGALEAMAERACTDYRGTHLVPGAGHWLQQEQAVATVDRILAFLAD